MPTTMISPLIILMLLFISPPIYSEEYEIFDPAAAAEPVITQPMISEGIVNHNQTMFEMEEDHERLCGQEGRLLKEKDNLLVQCSSDAECLPPSQCHTTGYCCMIALHQEPPPVGCPIGTRSLRNASGAELSCNPNVPNSCPGGALCYTDSLTNQRRCCGNDPGQGCPAGSKAILSDGGDTPLLCTPGRIACPNGGLCQWSHLIDRYQCCQPDNGCPRHQAPVKNELGATIECSLGGPPCPGGASCRFNFWTASYQCCRTDTTDLCPAGQVAFLNSFDSTPKSCQTDAGCPGGYLCGDNHLCCGEPGTCPSGNSAFKDVYGRLTSCSSRQGNTCPPTSTCMDSSFPGQKLCCSEEDYVCPGFAVPVPSARDPLRCSIGVPNSCPEGLCMPSNFKGTAICCRSTVIPPPPVVVVTSNPCPPGWGLQDNEITFCQPHSQYTTCPGFSSCIRSAVVPQQFVCCAPVNSPPRCRKSGARVELLPGKIPKRCANTRQCSKGFTCQPAIRDGWLCCSVPRAQAQTSLSCPASNQAPVITAGSNQLCQTPGQMGGQCPSNALCLAALGQNNIFICCITNNGGSTTPVCPNNAVPQPSNTGFVACGFNPALCASGYQCATAANDPNTRLCCSQSSSSLVVCPNNGSPLTDTNGQLRLCLPSQPNACPASYSCQAVLTPAGSFACCTTTQTARCPSGFQADISINGGVIFCDRSQPAGCPANSVCLLDQTTQQSLCCRTSAPALCPNGQSALLDGQGSVQQCTSPGASCPAAGYQCVFSNILSQYICCGVTNSPAVCADGRQTFTQTSGSTYTCNPQQLPSNCPFGYDCAQSTQVGISVCCFTNSATTISPPTSFLQCPSGWNPFRNSLNQQVQYCASTTDQSCPTGYSCTPSSQAAVYLCCRLASSPACSIGSTLLSNGQPRLCNRNLPNQCPRGYSCQQSTTPTITICCSSQFDDVLLCPDRSQPSMIGPNFRYCPVVNSNAGCPGGYNCQLSNQGTNVCCLSTFSPVRFSSSTGLAKCPNGVVPANSQRACTTVADCPPDSTCSASTGSNICCAVSVPPDTRCKARRTMLREGMPAACLPGSNCPSGFECSLETSNSRAVCCETPDKAQEVCPENRAAFLIARTEELVYCDSTAYICPNGQECVISKKGDRHVCCSPTARCPGGTTRPFGEAYPPRCFTSDDCPPEQACVSSTVDDVRVCCNVFFQDDRPSSSSSDDEWVVLEG